MIKIVLADRSSVGSLVPAFLHTKVANVCIEQRKDMVTASYVSKEMEELESR